jgi:competence protein ComEA
MNRFIQSAVMFLFVTVVLLISGNNLALFADDLQMFSNAALVDNPANDGDSFLIKTKEKSFRVRLYFVDCPEISVGSDADVERILEQTRYWGLSDVAQTVHFGKEAKAFTEHALAQPFTVYTSFANALGRTSEGRVYAFVTTYEGSDLASLLVKNGFARAHGVGRQTPNGVSRDEMNEKLQDFEVSAMLKRVGVWFESDPDKIAELRAKQRSEEQELDEFKEQVKEYSSIKSLIDLNTATREELMSIKGIGYVLAERIIEGRPYETVDDLLKVKGIGPKTLEKVRPYFVVSNKEQ